MEQKQGRSNQQGGATLLILLSVVTQLALPTLLVLPTQLTVRTPQISQIHTPRTAPTLLPLLSVLTLLILTTFKIYPPSLPSRSRKHKSHATPNPSFHTQFTKRVLLSTSIAKEKKNSAGRTCINAPFSLLFRACCINFVNTVCT